MLKVNEIKEYSPRCSTPKSLFNWGIFYALRKGKLQCKWPKLQLKRKSLKVIKPEDFNIIS